MAMQSCAWSVLVQTALVIAIPLVMGSNPEVGEDGDVKVEGESGIAKFFTVIRYVAMLGMYGGFSTVCVGAYMMEAPKSVYPDGPPPVSPAVACTMNLCFQYFGVYLGVAIIQTCAQRAANAMLRGRLGNQDKTIVIVFYNDYHVLIDFQSKCVF